MKSRGEALLPSSFKIALLVLVLSAFASFSCCGKQFTASL
jgi:hypothetical protein